MEPIIYLKLGGSLITDKKNPHTARLDVIDRVISEIKQSTKSMKHCKLILGHGSGSFGHVPAKKYQTRTGVQDNLQWQGFIEVWNEARTLNQIVIEACEKGKLPVMAFPPSAMIITKQGQPGSLNVQPILRAMDHGIIPLVNGDTVFDDSLGGTILSTEDIFDQLVNFLPPYRILLAGIEEGVWHDFPKCTKLIDKIELNSFIGLDQIAQGSESTDVTGGMLEKLRILKKIIQQHPKCKGLIFSGMIPGNIERALNGENPGTLVVSE